MKKVRIKEWVKILLIALNFLYVMLMSGDCDNFIVFTLSKIILMMGFIFNHLILTKYSDLYE